MKRITLLVGCLSLSVGSVSAQKKGLMGKINAAFEEAAAANDPNKPNAKEVKKDMESTTLDGKSINKDSRNLSGIYYAKTPIRVG